MLESSVSDTKNFSRPPVTDNQIFFLDMLNPKKLCLVFEVLSLDSLAMMSALSIFFAFKNWRYRSSSCLHVDMHAFIPIWVWSRTLRPTVRAYALNELYPLKFKLKVTKCTCKILRSTFSVVNSCNYAIIPNHWSWCINVSRIQFNRSSISASF